MESMRWNDLADQDCSLARSLAVLGDRWTLLVLREAFLQVRRFDAFQERLGIARAILTDRLGILVDQGILDRIAYQQRPERFDYRLTDKGLALYPVILSLVHWGDTYYGDAQGPPVLHRHKQCGAHFRAVLTCSACSEAIGARDVVAEAQR